MKKMLGVVIVTFLVFAICTGSALATNYEYSDATGYGIAKHTTGEWQRLGSTWNSEHPSVYADFVDSSDDGVFWSLDNGTTWGHEDLTAGQEVIFRFDMQRAPYGNHEYDQLKSWVDWDGDKVFEVSEVIIATQWFKNTATDGNTIWNDSDYWRYVDRHRDEGTNPRKAILEKSFFATMVVPFDSIISETWLRARVLCTDVAFDNLTPYGSIYQGEVEDYQVTINQRVPEPATMLLLGLGLVGLAGVKRKFRI